MSVNKTLIITALLITLGSTSALNSSCPDLFHYDSTSQSGRWTGTLTLLSDSELHGVWIRLIFDRKLTELSIGNNFDGEIVTSNNQEYLIKNRKFLLKSSTPVIIKIIVKYNEEEIPNLTEYRLNAKVVCSAKTPLRFFEGDLNDRDFLSSLKSNEKAFDYEFEGCGTVPSSVDNEVKNGKAQNGQWPWQAAIYIQKNNEEQYVCEGTLISSEYILTAAHCVTYVETELTVPTRRLTIYLGEYKIGQRSAGRAFQAGRIILYPAYNSSNLLNDLAVVRLDKPVVRDNYIRPICLRHSSVRKDGYLVGYGIKDKIEDLHQAQVKIIEEEECSRRHPDLMNLLTDNVFCASYDDDIPLCVGDSGSSLISLQEGPKAVWELKAIVTVGVIRQAKNVCDQSTTLLLTNISNYMKWIKSVIS